MNWTGWIVAAAVVGVGLYFGVPWLMDLYRSTTGK